MYICKTGKWHCKCVARISDVYSIAKQFKLFENIPKRLPNQNESVKVCVWCHHELSKWPNIKCCASKGSTVLKSLRINACFVLEKIVNFLGPDDLWSLDTDQIIQTQGNSYPWLVMVLHVWIPIVNPTHHNVFIRLRLEPTCKPFPYFFGKSRNHSKKNYRISNYFATILQLTALLSFMKINNAKMKLSMQKSTIITAPNLVI